jgi:hypothetical protein
MSTRLRWLCLVTGAALLLTAGCKRAENEPGGSQPAGGPSPSEIAAAVEAITKGMQPTAFESLNDAHIGQQCVVVTHSSNESTRVEPPPPPLGMIRRMGRTTVYKGEMCQLSSDGLKVRAAYPTSGNYKTVAIARADIQSVHLAE